MATSAIDDVHVGDVGTIIRIELKDDDVEINLSSASVKQIKFKNPSGEVVTQTAVFTTDGTDGRIQYVTEADDINESGTWEYQAYIEMGGGKWHSEKLTFLVRENLS